MYCPYCGSELHAPEQWCTACGRSVPSTVSARPPSRWRAIALFGGLCLLVTAAGLWVYLHRNSTGSPDRGPGPSSRASSIREIDFQNFTFTPECTSKEPVTTTRGVFERNDPKDYVWFHVDDAVYGDLTADGSDEAVVNTLCGTGGSGKFGELMVYQLENGSAKLLTTLDGGDRASGGIHVVSLDRGVLVLDRYGEDGSGACCPDLLVVSRQRWNGSQFIEEGQPRRLLYVPDGLPQQPTVIRFPPGQSTMLVTETTDGSRLFGVAVQAGQTLRVRVLKGSGEFAVYAGTPARAYLGRIEDEWQGQLQEKGEYLILARRHARTQPTRETFSLEVTVTPGT